MSHIMILYLSEMSRIGKSIYREKRFIVARGWGGEGNRVAAKRYVVPF